MVQGPPSYQLMSFHLPIFAHTGRKSTTSFSPLSAIQPLPQQARHSTGGLGYTSAAGLLSGAGLSRSSSSSTSRQDKKERASYPPENNRCYFGSGSSDSKQKNTYGRSNGIGSLGSDAVREGFSNLGNTCYLNSVTQAIIASKSFTDDLLSKFWINETLADLQNAEKAKEKLCVYSPLVRLLLATRQKGHGVISPTSFREVRWKVLAYLSNLTDGPLTLPSFLPYCGCLGHGITVSRLWNIKTTRCSRILGWLTQCPARRALLLWKAIC